MWEWLEHWFGQGFMPHGHCYLWSAGMIWTQVSSNLCIGVAYASIATTLALLVRRIEGIPFAWVYWAFGTFILSCGLTHFFDVITVWHPIYWADAGVRVLTASASVATAILIVPMVPKAAAFAGDARLSAERGRQLEIAHAELEKAHAQLAEREREAQQRARASEEQLRLLVQTMPQLAYIADPQGRTTFRNQRWQEYTGLVESDPGAEIWQSVHHPDTKESVLSTWAHAIESEETFELEARFRRADGEYRWFLLRATPLLREGEVLAWMGTCTDVHDQHLAHDEALRAARMKDEFLATVSHELRTPLNAILGWSRLLKDGKLALEKRARAFEAVERNAVAQARLVDDLLDVSRIISGKMRVESSSINPADAIEAALDAVRPAAVAKGVELTVNVDRAAGHVLADSSRIQQIVWNLAGNAVKFTPKGGSVHVGVARRGAQVQIVVSDTGIGIKPHFLNHLFERFSQEDGSIRRSHGGLGLGLAISKQLVELHGGEIRAESPGENQGTTLTVTLPISDAPPPAAARASDHEHSDASLDAPPGLQGLRVLLVEDDADSREVVAAILSENGVDIVSAENAEHALDLLVRNAIDVILSDIGLPGLDGYAFIRAVRRDPRFANTPAAALTAYAHAEDQRRTAEAGFQAHVKKPFDPDELFSVLSNLAKTAIKLRA